MNYIKGIIFITLILVLSRIIPHPPNFTPILAGIIFLPFIKKDLTFSIIAPLAAMLISDLIIGMHSLMLWTYAPIIFLSCLTYYFNQDSILRIGTLAVVSPMVFFLVSNFGVWISGSSYTEDMSGLIECYFNAIPFYASSAISCLLFTALFYFLRLALLKRNFLLN
ncbi:MAG: DUF6580 family putative transport protein [Gammaproteobacteria bacterium]